MSISIAIPTYNRCESVACLVDSLLPQLSSDDELLVVDDGSQDGTTDYLSKLPQVRLISHPTNQGMVKTWNACLTAATGEWVCMIHDDDTPTPHAIATIRRACSVLNTPALISHRSELPELDNCFRYRVAEAGPWAALQCFLPSGTTVHKKIIASVGVFDRKFSYSPDLEYFSRICAKFPSLVIESPQIISFNMHNQNYEYKTWEKPNFLEQLEAIEKLVISYAGLSGDDAVLFFERRMNQHIQWMLKYSSNADNKTLLKKVGSALKSRSYLGRRNRTKAYIASLLNWYPSL